jgi:hypothetical protein
MSFVVVVLAIALRVAWVLAVPTKPVGDFAMYVESAAHLVEHGGFDGEFVYMPGYILLIAPVQALGGGWLATKLVGAVLGGLGAGPVFGITRRLPGGSGPTALVAGLLYACWPAGIALASVTGTDMPAAVLVVTAAYFLLRFAGSRPMLASILFGLFTGLAAYIRAIVVPLAVLLLLVFRARGLTWRASAKSTTVACVVALLMLSPWAVRNRFRYGETFLTDSHGGLTALVGANPNTDGRYSRSLNRMFRDVTGFTLLTEPHREADRVALELARGWIKFDPLFTAGLLASKAERLLVHERALLYWPLFRAGVLPEPERAFFARHRSAVEEVADGFWLAILALALMGCALAYLGKQWLALSLLPQAVALAVLYTAIFSEPRYRLPIFMFLLPLSALALRWLFELVRDLVRGRPAPRWRREAALATGFATLVFVAAPALAWAGERLREHHQWAVSECVVAGRPRFCEWRTTRVQGDLDGRPGIAGVWNGVGIALPRSASHRPAEIEISTELSLEPGDYVLNAALDIAPIDPSEASASGTISFVGDDQPLSSAASLAEVSRGSRQRQTLAWSALVQHKDGPFRLRVRVEVPETSAPAFRDRVWLSDLTVLPKSGT